MSSAAILNAVAAAQRSEATITEEMHVDLLKHVQFRLQRTGPEGTVTPVSNFASWLTLGDKDVAMQFLRQGLLRPDKKTDPSFQETIGRPDYTWTLQGSEYDPVCEGLNTHLEQLKSSFSSLQRLRDEDGADQDPAKHLHYATCFKRLFQYSTQLSTSLLPGMKRLLSNNVQEYIRAEELFDELSSIIASLKFEDEVAKGETSALCSATGLLWQLRFNASSRSLNSSLATLGKYLDFSMEARKAAKPNLRVYQRRSGRSDRDAEDYDYSEELKHEVDELLRGKPDVYTDYILNLSLQAGLARLLEIVGSQESPSHNDKESAPLTAESNTPSFIDDPLEDKTAPEPEQLALEEGDQGLTKGQDESKYSPIKEKKKKKKYKSGSYKRQAKKAKSHSVGISASIQTELEEGRVQTPEVQRQEQVEEDKITRSVDAVVESIGGVSLEGNHLESPDSATSSGASQEGWKVAVRKNVRSRASGQSAMATPTLSRDRSNTVRTLFIGQIMSLKRLAEERVEPIPRWSPTSRSSGVMASKLDLTSHRRGEEGTTMTAEQRAQRVKEEYNPNHYSMKDHAKSIKDRNHSIDDYPVLGDAASRLPKDDVEREQWAPDAVREERNRSKGL